QTFLLRDSGRQDVINEARREFRVKDILFYGCNITDVELRSLLDQVRDQNSYVHSAYAVWSGLSKNDVQIWRDHSIAVLDVDPFDIVNIEGGKQSVQQPNYEERSTADQRIYRPKSTGIALIGIVTALEKEYAAMEVMLDNPQDYVVPGLGAGRRYRRGTVPGLGGGQHTVLLALTTDMGNNALGTRISLMLQHFPQMKHVLIVAIAGGVPNLDKVEDHVRLGDVVVSDRGSVVQYDLGKEEYDYAENKPKFVPRYPPRPPGADLLEAVRLMRAGELRGERTWLKYLERAARLPNSARPADDMDKLYDAIQPDILLAHPLDPQRVPGQPRVFLGIIGSNDRLRRNPVLRDELRKQYGVKAIEMEGAGVADAAWQLDRGYLVISGICDYCDGHKNDVWQEYAAAVAAAYTRGLLTSMPVEEETTRVEMSRMDFAKSFSAIYAKLVGSPSNKSPVLKESVDIIRKAAEHEAIDGRQPDDKDVTTAAQAIAFAAPDILQDIADVVLATTENTASGVLEIVRKVLEKVRTQRGRA
ncbi:partial 5'-methylthioadenosine/S-adenosylhomocysteine nucleosidase, partial [Gammaproteobacteria bacterium]